MTQRYDRDERIVMTLDGGGTNFVFSAVRGEMEVVETIVKPSCGDNLDMSLETIVRGFSEILEEVSAKFSVRPCAISFCFPGPADYEKGIIGDLVNLPGYRGGVAIGPMLEDLFGVPVFSNNDGDLFTLGESIAGFLPEINKMLEVCGSPKRFRNLLGVTFGTGFGGGIARDGEIFHGDNSASGEINRIRNRLRGDCSSEVTVSIEGVRSLYAGYAGISTHEAPGTLDIYRIGTGEIPGNSMAAIRAFDDFGVVAADALAGAATLVDGLIVIGGGLSGAYPLFLGKIVTEMNKPYVDDRGMTTDHLEVKVFNLEVKSELEKFLAGDVREVRVPRSERSISYDPLQRIGIGVTRLGTARSVSIGAYAFALRELDKKGLPHL